MISPLYTLASSCLLDLRSTHALLDSTLSILRLTAIVISLRLPRAWFCSHKYLMRFTEPCICLLLFNLTLTAVLSGADFGASIPDSRSTTAYSSNNSPSLSGAAHPVPPNHDLEPCTKVRSSGLKSHSNACTDKGIAGRYCEHPCYCMQTGQFLCRVFPMTELPAASALHLTVELTQACEPICKR